MQYRKSIVESNITVQYRKSIVESNITVQYRKSIVESNITVQYGKRQEKSIVESHVVSSPWFGVLFFRYTCSCSSGKKTYNHLVFPAQLSDPTS